MSQAAPTLDHVLGPAAEAATADLDVQLRNDLFKDEGVAELTTERVTAELAGLLSYAHQWAPPNGPTLTFSSMLAAMMASDKPLCRWLQRYLGLRGASIERMTGGKTFTPNALPARLQTTRSFRTALAVARDLHARTGASSALDVRHFMAAYAVCRDYHLADFLRLRIDRRAWCLELADHLASAYPDEQAAWQRYAGLATEISPLAFTTDAPVGRDLLSLDREVEAFARLIAARSTVTPLSIGVFGAWGSGKSFFMERVRERVAELAPRDDGEARTSPYHGRIAQVAFNAWHYSEGSLIASLVDHIFRNLRIGRADEDEAVLRQRSADLLVQIDDATRTLAGKQHELDGAEARRAAAQQALDDLERAQPAAVAAKQQEIAKATQAAREAQVALTEATQQQQAEIDAAQARAPARAALALFRKDLGDPTLDGAVKDVTALIESARTVGAKWAPIALGLVVLAIGGLATWWLGSTPGVQLASLTTSIGASIGAFAVIARSWLTKLDAIAKRGEEFQAAQARIAREATAAIVAAHKPAMDALAEAQQARAGGLDQAKRELAALLAAAGIQQAELEAWQNQRAVALDVRERAVAELAARKAQLADLSTGSLLGEFLDDRAATDGYRKGLTIFSQVRNDFDRLSKLMMRATDEYLHHGKPAPPVTRIVLYIDDLDRCPEARVIEVLRVVHLLLAFPLFVCVAAVDPRWVTQCLRQAPGLIDHALPATTESELGAPATAADYLEKIFQIPLWLRPVPAAQRPSIVRALLDPERSPAMPRIAPDPELVQQLARHRIEPGHDVIHPARAQPTSDPTIDAIELDYLEQLASLLGGNPRALKRFVNTYRLVKSALSDVEQQVFRGEVRLLGVGESPGTNEPVPRYVPYRMCMVQLAVLCTQRERALRMVRLADGAARDTELATWLTDLGRVDRELSDALATTMIGSPGPAKLDTFQLWLERTRRYSFYV